jgi:Flp pilus assembly protein TadD
MLAPVIGLVQIGAATMADRYTYLPQIGLAIAVVWAVGAQCRSSERRRWVCMVASVFLLAILMGGAWRQTCFWRNGATVWTHALACTSRNSVAHNGLGAILLRQRRIDEAIAQFQRAVDIAPGYFLARANLGAALLLRGRVDEAITQYRKALELDPGDAESHTSLAMALAGRGQFNEAVAHYQKALEINPNVVEPHNNMAWLQATCPVTELRSGDKAIEHAQRANRLCRGRRADALDTLAAAYAERGQFPEALATVRKALDLATQQHDQRLADTLRSRTKLYAAGKPYRPTRLQSVCLPAK